MDDADTPAPVEQVAPVDDEALDVEEVVVVAERPITAASALTASADDLRVRPLGRPADVAEVMPGLFAVQHAGGGKANQYFVRGFDADHGTDVALAVDGIPVNMVSHGHGQGYADLHFLIPELVSRVDVRKGPYEAFDGDLATAGAVDMFLVDKVEESYATATLGSFQTYRGLGVLGLQRGGTHGVIAGEVYATDGPFQTPEGLVRYNAYGKLTTELADTARVSVGALAYASGWTASGQIPLRAVEAGTLSRFGTLDPTEGGQSTRRQLWLDATIVDGDKSALTARAWAGAYRLNMFSNFTFFAADPVNGDQIEQQDERTFAGFDTAYKIRRELGLLTFDTRLGAQGRADRIGTGLWHSRQRERLSTTVDSHVEETRMGAYVREEVGIAGVVRLIGSLRGDTFTFGVDDNLDVLGDGVVSSGVRDAQVLSPKANLILSPTSWLDLFANYGQGFHSNDARGIVRSEDPVDPITKGTGYEAGLRLHRSNLGQVAVAAWALDLDRETVWVGDEGTTELRGATARHGLDASLRLQPLPWLIGDLDVTLARAVYTQNAGNGDAVALAPTSTLAGGLGVVDLHGASGGVRVRHIAARPAIEDGSLVAQGWTILSGEARYRHRAVELGLQVDNLLNATWREVQFANESRMANEREPVEDIHFTPGWPLTAMASLTLYR